MSVAMYLRDIEERDLEALYEHQTDPGAAEMAAFKARDHDAFMAHWKKVLADASGLKRAIVVGEEVAGHVVSWTSGEQRAIGYWVARAHWGRGLATQALTEFLKIEKTRPLTAHVAKHNLGSVRVLLRNHFVLIDETHVSDEHGEVDEQIYELRA